MNAEAYTRLDELLRRSSNRIDCATRSRDPGQKPRPRSWKPSRTEPSCAERGGRVHPEAR